MKNWSPQQSNAIQQVSAWLRDKRGPQVFSLFGYAGTGKTTLAKHLADDFSGHVAYACYTGKAALVMRKKGCDNASTIHSLIYKAIEDQETGEFEFVLDREGGAADADLIVIDEVSMVGAELATDLLSFGKKVLVLGDPAQLPPVKSEGYFTTGTPDVMLTEVHRQAEDNPIIRMSMDIREGRRLTPGAYGNSLVLSRNAISKDALGQAVLDSDQMLCGLNKTRHTFNARIREMKGLSGTSAKSHPVEGDRLVCLRNKREKSLFNGGLWTAKRVAMTKDILHIRAESLDEDKATPVDIEVPKQFFEGTDQDLDWRLRRAHDEFTFGWVLTCHKAQGSQWDNVLVYDESRAFREDADKWLYTAVTRAADKVTVVL